jgi:hypothetical protein
MVTVDSSIDTLPPTLQRYVLIVLYYATGGEDWFDQFRFFNATNSHERRSTNCWLLVSSSPIEGSNVGVLVCWADDTIGSLSLGAYGK